MTSGMRIATRPGAYCCVARPEAELVLLVEDYDETREMYAEFLELAGFRVAEAGTGDFALRTVHQRQPSLVVMDLALPDMSGCEAASRIRADARTMDIPIIALTAYSRHEAADVAFRAGCNVFLEKPLAPSDLADQIKRLLRRSETTP